MDDPKKRLTRSSKEAMGAVQPLAAEKNSQATSVAQNNYAKSFGKQRPREYPNLILNCMIPFMYKFLRSRGPGRPRKKANTRPAEATSLTPANQYANPVDTPTPSVSEQISLLQKTMNDLQAIHNNLHDVYKKMTAEAQEQSDAQYQSIISEVENIHDSPKSKAGY
eukprot:m.167897 g.167897  ORF g.167897 m.167897 type:complete len:166 (+) comp15309_c0_seq1:144-641(+)